MDNYYAQPPNNKQQTYQYCISYVFFDVINLLFFLLLRETVHMQNAHLLNYCGLSRLSGAQQEQPMCGPVQLFVLLQLLRNGIAASLLASGVLWVDVRLLGAGRAKATHGRPRYPPAGLSAPAAFLCAVGRFGAPVFFVLLSQSKPNSVEVSGNLERTMAAILLSNYRCALLLYAIFLNVAYNSELFRGYLIKNIRLINCGYFETRSRTSNPRRLCTLNNDVCPGREF